jgi:hypothetical protein
VKRFIAKETIRICGDAPSATVERSIEVLKRNSAWDLLENFMSARLGPEAGFGLGARAGISPNTVGSDDLWLSQKPETRMNTPAFAAQRSADRREMAARRRDFYHCYDLLLANWYLLTSPIQQDLESVREDLHDDLARWRPHEPELNWGAFADRLKTIAARVAAR